MTTIPKLEIPKLETLIKKAKFDYVELRITKNFFPQPKELRTEYKLFHFNEFILSEGAIKKMNEEGHEPANAWELLDWKGWNKKDWVVALGSVGEVSGSRRVLYLGSGGSERLLYLGYWDGGWDTCYRFLGVRNLPSETKVLGNDLGNLDSLTLAIEEVKKAGYVIYKPI